MRTELTSTAYTFGNPVDRAYGSMIFRPGGEIGGYRNPNEERWELATDGCLRLFGASGRLQSEFWQLGDSAAFQGQSTRDNVPFYLFPLIKHEARVDSALPNVLINSLPKSGTYFLEKILKEAGWRATRLHLVSGGYVDDYRGLPDEQMHVEPEKLRIRCSSQCVSALLGHGELIVGHLATLDELWGVAVEGVRIINVVRNVRNVLTSLYRFKLTRVLEREGVPESWRGTEESMKFVEFLKFYTDRDIGFLSNMLRFLLSNRGYAILRFEDIMSGNISALQPLCDASHIELEYLRAAAERSRGQVTPTWSGELSSWENVWSHDAEEIFKESGLFELNGAFGYEG